MADPTSQYITEIEADGDLNVALQNFSIVCGANSAGLSLSPANLLEISGAAAGFSTTLNAWVVARSGANLAKDNKDAQKKASKAIVSKWAKTFRANPLVPDALLDQLMLPDHKTPGTKTPPTQPLNLVANADGLGLVKLVWKANGNRYGTVFMVETRSSTSEPWVSVDSTTKTKFTYQASPGEYIGFRVTAKRGTLSSPASVPVVLWESGEGVQLKVAA